jgi:site-specific recombinase XerD
MEILLDAGEDVPDLLGSPQIGNGVGKGIVIFEQQRGAQTSPAPTPARRPAHNATPMTGSGFFKTLARAAERIGMDGVRTHLLRPACGFKLVNHGIDTRTLAAYLGHRQIANTARYTEMDVRRFDGFWRD